MSRFSLIKLIDVMAFALFVLLGSTGLLLHFVFVRFRKIINFSVK
jgi:hypothetical protein